MRSLGHFLVIEVGAVDGGLLLGGAYLHLSLGDSAQPFRYLLQMTLSTEARGQVVVSAFYNLFLLDIAMMFDVNT